MKKKIICLGDSLTKGMVGYSYSDFINKNYEIINKGINGDTTICSLERLNKTINDYEKIDTFILSIGINDILVPFLSTLSNMWKLETKFAKLDTCLLNSEDYKAVFSSLLTLLKNHHKKVIVLGMPLIELEDFPNEETIKRNNDLKLLTKQNGFMYIDSYSIQNSIIDEMSTISWDKKNFKVLLDYSIMAAKPSLKDNYSEKRNLNLTVDGVHFNKLSASLIGEAINICLKKIM